MRRSDCICARLSIWKTPVVSALLDRGERRGIVEGDPREVDPLAARAGDQLDGALDRGEHPQPEQVDLQEAGVGAGVLVPLDELAALHRRRHHRAAVDQRPGRDDHPAGMLGDVARQPERLPREARRARPSARRARALPERAREVALDLSRCPKAVGAARDTLDLARRQPEHLAELADRAARAKAREGRDERRAVAAVALVDTADQDLADVAREVEVDVRQRGQLGVQEAPHREAAGERVDVREAGQVADDRGDRGAASAAGRQQRARRVGAAHLAATSRESSRISWCSRKKPASESVSITRQLLLEARAGLAQRRRPA